MTKQLRLLAVLAAIAVVIGVLAYASARYSVSSITKSIDAIGKVSYSEESRRLIDAADEKLNALDSNLHLDGKIENISVLKAAKVTYVEQAIIRMYRAARDKQDEETIKQYLADAEEAFDHYLTEEDIPLVHNYQDLLDVREKYGDKTEKLPGKDLKDRSPGKTTIDLC